MHGADSTSFAAAAAATAASLPSSMSGVMDTASAEAPGSRAAASAAAGFSFFAAGSTGAFSLSSFGFSSKADHPLQGRHHALVEHGAVWQGDGAAGALLKRRGTGWGGGWGQASWTCCLAGIAGGVGRISFLEGPVLELRRVLEKKSETKSETKSDWERLSQNNNTRVLYVQVIIIQ